MEPAWLYILTSPNCNRFYIGFTTDLSTRLDDHNNSRSKFTRKKGPWSFTSIVYTSDAANEKRAEAFVKKLKLRDIVTAIIDRTFEWPEAFAAHPYLDAPPK